MSDHQHDHQRHERQKGDRVYGENGRQETSDHAMNKIAAYDRPTPFANPGRL